ncbi:hypothetical protein [Pseudolysinimonas sp.]|uniref:hypothetical protein n=1 Tax=Pseudolysinimonas sp. TaxID=2680009 RepID=UPI0037844F5A
MTDSACRLGLARPDVLRALIRNAPRRVRDAEAAITEDWPGCGTRILAAVERGDHLRRIR